MRNSEAIGKKLNRNALTEFPRSLVCWHGGCTVLFQGGTVRWTELLGRLPKGLVSLVRVKPDDAIAVLVDEARQGNELAAYMLAVIYETGSGVKRDTHTSWKWLRQAISLNPGAVLTRIAADCSSAAL